YHAQTPQAFLYSIIRTAHDMVAAEDLDVTDGVSLVLAAGFRIKMTDGDFSNFKITSTSDYRTACLIANKILSGDTCP
ncbi:MAG: 2-C-methyl-D-erythritol 4-phosphate cytidylyltransferase, partial [Chrysiogenales bacterium]